MKILILAFCLSPFFAVANCAPTMTLDSVPRLTLGGDAAMVSHTESFDIAISAQQFNDRLVTAPLQQLLPGTQKIPAVIETRALTGLPFGQPGAPRVVCLADGSTAVEETVENLSGKVFRYKVWNYSTEVAKPIEYGIGSFELTPLDDTHTLVKWTYSFKLRDTIFPGSFGSLGRWLFQHSFVNGDYADMMRGSAKAMQAYFK